jgi:hypothetical protein
MTLTLQSRNSLGLPRETTEEVDPQKVALLIMDAWGYHWCRTWRNRAGSLIPRLNHALEGARKLGLTLIFSPTHCMRDLNETPQRLNALAVPHHPLPEPQPIRITHNRALIYGACECGHGEDCYFHNTITNQHPDLHMAEEDFIGLELQETYNILAERGITHVILAGFATNMCLWGKPAGMKNLLRYGFRCLVARDLTEAITRYAEECFNPTEGTLNTLYILEQQAGPSISMEETLRRAGVWEALRSEWPGPINLRMEETLRRAGEGKLLLDYVHLAPWDRLFNAPGHVYPVQVEMTCRFQPEADIHYTLDGRDPTLSSPLYMEPVRISETTILKAAGFRYDRQVTRVSTGVYSKMPPMPDPPDVFVSDLKPAREVVGKVQPNRYAVDKPARFNRSVDGHVLRNRGLAYFKGLGVQAPSELVFDLRPEYRRFVAMAGVDDECMVWDFPDGLPQWPQWSQPIHSPTAYRVCRMVFEVQIDGQRAAQSPAMFIGDRAWGFDVPIPAGAKQIALVARDEETPTSDPHGHGDWLNAGFITA